MVQYSWRDTLEGKANPGIFLFSSRIQWTQIQLISDSKANRSMEAQKIASGMEVQEFVIQDLVYDEV